MPRGDHLIISDELDDYLGCIEENPALVGAVVTALRHYWSSGGADAVIPDGVDPNVMSVFYGQLDRFRHSVTSRGGKDVEERREYNRRRQANLRAKKAGKPLPYPEDVANVANVANVAFATNATDATPCDKCDSRDSDVALKPNQTNPNQTSAGAQARVCACESGAATSNSEIVAAFNALWEAYPDRKRQSRPKAMDAYRAKVLSGAVPPIDAVLASLARWKASFDWRKAGGMYIPSIANWIDQERWNDTPAGEYTADTIPLSEAAPSAVPPMDEETRRLFATA